MTAEQLEKVERLVNAKIFENHAVRAFETSLASAREAGVTALFGEKYGEFVRVLEIGNFSRELCGGTHVGRTSELGLLKIVSEGSVGANLRRIEAVTSFDAIEHVYGEEAVLAKAAAALKCRPNEVAEKAEALTKKLRESEKAAKHAASARVDADKFELWQPSAGYPLHVGRLDGLDAEALRGIADEMRGADGAVLMFSVSDGKVVILASGSKPAVDKGFDAGALVKAVTPAVGGRGGGKPQMAQGGGPDPAGIDDAVAAARATLGIG
jgi:alanyl-tRNA synthetase